MKDKQQDGKHSEIEQQLFEWARRNVPNQIYKHVSSGRVFPNCRNPMEETPLIVAAKAASAAAAAALISGGAEVDAVGADGQTALGWAAALGHLEVVKVLVPKADLDKKNNDGLTPWEIAKRNGHDAVKDFLEAQSVGSTKDVQMETSTDPDDDGPSAPGPAGASLPVAAAMMPSPEPGSYVPQLDLEALPSVAESPYFKVEQKPDTTTEDRKQEAEAQPKNGESESVVTEIPVSDDGPGVPPAAIPIAEASETASAYTEVGSESSNDKSVDNRDDEGTAPAKANHNPVVEAPKGSGNDKKTSVENTHTNPIEAILTFVMGMVMPGVANPRLMYDLLCQGALERFRGRTINEAAQDIHIIVLSAVSNILMFLGYYILVAFFDKDPTKAFSRNPKKQVSLNELAQQKGMPFTRQRLSECVRCAALDMALRQMGLHLDSLTYYHYAEAVKLPKLKDQIALAQLAELQRLTAGEVKERVGKQLGKTSSEDKRIAKAVMRNVGDILRLLTDEETQDFLKDKERMKAAFEPTESTALLGNIRKLKKKIPVTEALFTDLEPSLLDLLREYTHQDEGVDVEVEEHSE
jgi:hypothetical protein